MRGTKAGARGDREGGARPAILCVGALAAFFCALLFLVPCLEGVGLDAAGGVRAMFAPLCHQSPARSLDVGAGIVAVCARCTGLYVGGAAGLLVAVWLVGARGWRPRPELLALAVAPTLIDAALPWVGLAGLPNVPRFVLAVPAGVVAGLFLAVGVEDLFRSGIRESMRIRFRSEVRCAVEELDE